MSDYEYDMHASIHAHTHTEQYLALLAANLNPQFTPVCNNAAWSMGEIAIKIGQC